MYCAIVVGQGFTQVVYIFKWHPEKHRPEGKGSKGRDWAGVRGNAPSFTRTLPASPSVLRCTAVSGKCAGVGTGFGVSRLYLVL